MTTLQTQTTPPTPKHAYSLSSAGSTSDRALSTTSGANSASEFAGLLDAFSEDDSVAEVVDQDSDDSVSESGSDSDDSTVNTGSSKDNTGDPDAAADEIQQLLPVPAVKVNSTGDIARQLSHAADIDLASLAGAQLSKNSALSSDPARSAENATQKQPETQPENLNSSQQNPHQPQRQELAAHQHRIQLPQNLQTNHVESSRTTTTHPQPAQAAVPEPASQQTNLVNTQALGNPVQQSSSQNTTQLNTQIGVQAVFAQRHPDLATQAKSDAIRAINEASSQSSVRTVAQSESSNLGAGQGNQDQRTMDFANNATNANKLAQQSSDENAVMRQRVMNQVQRGLASIMNTKGGTMKIRLSPEHLGEVNIALKASDGHVQVTIDARNEQARTMLSEGLDDLRLILESKGVQVDELRMQNSQENVFSRFLGDTLGSADQNSAGDQGPTPDNQSGQNNAHDQGLNEDPSTQNESRGIWTELGLDAIA